MHELIHYILVQLALNIKTITSLSQKTFCLRSPTNLGWIYLQHTRIAQWNFLLLLLIIVEIKKEKF